jgi:hypothetical protein
VILSKEEPMSSPPDTLAKAIRSTSAMVVAGLVHDPEVLEQERRRRGTPPPPRRTPQKRVARLEPTWIPIGGLRPW